MAGAMSFGDIENLWIQNGGAPAKAPLFAAIALAESGGDATALNNNPATGDYSVGLWQINYYDGLLQSRTAQFGPPASLQGNANAQAKAAIALSNNGTNLAPWKGDPAAAAYSAGKPIPAQYTNGAVVAPGQNTANASPAAGSNGSCQPVGPQLKVGGGTLGLNSCQVSMTVGVSVMLVSGIVVFIGLGILLAGMGGRKVPSPVAFIVGEAQGRGAAKRKARASSQAQEDRLQLIDARGQQRRATGTPRASKDLGEPFPE